MTGSSKIRLFSSPCTEALACQLREGVRGIQKDLHGLSSFCFRLTRVQQLKILNLDLLKTNAYQELLKWQTSLNPRTAAF
jgi:hypothetical protein